MVGPRAHARDLHTSGHYPSSSQKISTVNLRHSSHLGTKFNHIPLQTFFSRVLLLRQQPFLSENLPLERPTTTIAMKNTSRHVSLRTRKFDKKISALLLQR